GGQTEEVLHLVTVEYCDSDGSAEDQVIWEREMKPRVFPPTDLPRVEEKAAMVPEHFDAMVRAARWSALRPYLDPDAAGPLKRLPLSSPLHGAIQVEDYQLVPLLKALRMPRVSLFLADDVGLGKTIEAGLILQELLLRRRIRRVMILCPASLRSQWQQEMKDKFCLSFDVVDRDAIHQLQKRVGMDANPWRLFPRVITNFEYLRQPDVFESFRAASRTPEGSAQLPWDLVIVDEAHNLAPAPIGEPSEQSKMLRRLCPLFEHRLFLSATPHNGHTRSFTGLLETLDPVRFTSKSDALTEAERGRVEQVLIRRLKSEINEQSATPRFASRHPPAGLELDLSREEIQLSQAFSAFRSRVRSIISKREVRESRAGSFAVEILGKRLLSNPTTFADSWHRYMQGMKGEADASLMDVRAAQRASEQPLSDDQENETRIALASVTVGSWMKPLADHLSNEIAAIDDALKSLGLSPSEGPLHPNKDTRFQVLQDLIEERLRTNGAFRDDERLIIFTEYKTTLDAIKRRLSALYPGDGRIRVLYGGG
ncbi:MAG TPA: SNF2-related protein, partial [Planctomycetota bacterium]|nr:SNF2-related protein [Planctomycetota bacterium]